MKNARKMLGVVFMLTTTLLAGGCGNSGGTNSTNSGANSTIDNNNGSTRRDTSSWERNGDQPTNTDTTGAGRQGGAGDPTRNAPRNPGN